MDDNAKKDARNEPATLVTVPKSTLQNAVPKGTVSGEITVAGKGPRRDEVPPEPAPQRISPQADTGRSRWDSVTRH